MLYIGLGIVGPPVVYLIWCLMWWDDFEGMRSEWEFRQQLKERQPLSTKEFYQQYYQDTGIPIELVSSFLSMHARFWNERAELLRPKDDLFKINDGLDAVGDWMTEVKKGFGINIADKDCESLTDGSFDALVRLLNRKIKESKQ